MNRVLLSALYALLALIAQPLWAATMSYSGKLLTETGTPVVGGYVVAGTFAPGFDPFDYNCVYGDPDCNQVGGSFGSAYDSAVGEGNFIPIGAGTFTLTDGSFSGSGDSAASVGTQIWLFGFEDGSRNSQNQALASSSLPSWQVPFVATSLSASDADVFVMGAPHPEGVSLTSIPVPEPASLHLVLLLSLLAAAARSRARPLRPVRPVQHAEVRDERGGVAFAIQPKYDV